MVASVREVLAYIAVSSAIATVGSLASFRLCQKFRHFSAARVSLYVLAIVSLPIAWPWWLIHVCFNIPMFTIKVDREQGKGSDKEVGISYYMYHCKTLEDSSLEEEIPEGFDVFWFGLVLLCPFLTFFASLIIVITAFSNDSSVLLFGADNALSIALVVCVGANALSWFCALLCVAGDDICENPAQYCLAIVCSPLVVPLLNCMTLSVLPILCRVLDAVVLFLLGSDAEEVLTGKLSMKSWKRGLEYEKCAKALRQYQQMRADALGAVLMDVNVVRIVLGYVDDLERNDEDVRRDGEVVIDAFQLQMALVEDYEREHQSLERIVIIPSDSEGSLDA